MGERDQEVTRNSCSYGGNTPSVVEGKPNIPLVDIWQYMLTTCLTREWDFLWLASYYKTAYDYFKGIR